MFFEGSHSDVAFVFLQSHLRGYYYIYTVSHPPLITVKGALQILLAAIGLTSISAIFHTEYIYSFYIFYVASYTFVL